MAVQCGSARETPPLPPPPATQNQRKRRTRGSDSVFARVLQTVAAAGAAALFCPLLPLGSAVLAKPGCTRQRRAKGQKERASFCCWRARRVLDAFFFFFKSGPLLLRLERWPPPVSAARRFKRRSAVRHGAPRERGGQREGGAREKQRAREAYRTPSLCSAAALSRFSFAAVRLRAQRRGKECVRRTTAEEGRERRERRERKKRKQEKAERGRLIVRQSHILPALFCFFGGCARCPPPGRAAAYQRQHERSERGGHPHGAARR